MEAGELVAALDGEGEGVVGRSEAAGFGDGFETPGGGERGEVIEEGGEKVSGSALTDGEGQFGEDAGDAGDGSVAKAAGDGFGEDAVVPDEADGTEVGVGSEGFENGEAAAAVFDAGEAGEIAEEFKGKGRLDFAGEGGEVVEESRDAEVRHDLTKELAEVGLLIEEEMRSGQEQGAGAVVLGFAGEAQGLEPMGGTDGGDYEARVAEHAACANDGFAALVGGGGRVFARGAVQAKAGDGEFGEEMDAAVEGVPEDGAGVIAGQEDGRDDAGDVETRHTRIVVSIRV